MPDQFLAIRNWDKYQADDKGNVRGGSSPWVKDWTDKEADRGYMNLTVFQRYILDGCRRLRGKLGKNIPNDPMYIARALNVLPTERARVVNTIATLTERLFLVLSNQELDFTDKDKELDKEEEKKELKAFAEPPKQQPKKTAAKSTETSSVQAVMFLPLNSGEEFGVLEEDFAKWKEFYPAVDVLQELRSMAAWCHANPTRRKTKSGVKAFINRWLAKSQNEPKAAANFKSGAVNGKSSAEQRIDRNNEKYTRIEQRISGLPENLGASVSGGTGRSGIGNVDPRIELLPPIRNQGSS